MNLIRKLSIFAAAGIVAASLAGITAERVSAQSGDNPPGDLNPTEPTTVTIAPGSTVGIAPGSNVGIDPARNTVSLASPIALLNNCQDPVCSVEGGTPFQVSVAFESNVAATLMRVAPGKVAIVKHISANAATNTNWANNPNATPLAGAQLATSGGSPHWFAWTTQGLTGGLFGVFTQSFLSSPVVFYGRGGSTITFTAYASLFRNGNTISSEGSRGSVTISGVIVNEN